MHADRYQLCKCGDHLVDRRIECHNPVVCQNDMLLHKAIEATGTELTGTQIIFCDHVILLYRCVGDHDHAVPRLKDPLRVVYNISDSFMDQSHRKLLSEYLCRSCALIIALICMTDRQMCRSDDYFISLQTDILKCNLKSTGCH